MKSYETPEVLVVIDALARDINTWADRKGFNKIPESLEEFLNDNPEANLFVQKALNARDIALMHSELSEQLEGQRKPGPSGLEGFTSDEEEVADLVIRALHYSGKHFLRLGLAISAKMAKNEGRPYMHGKAF